MIKRFRLGVLCLVVLGLLVAACGDGGDSETTTTASADPTTTEPQSEEPTTTAAESTTTEPEAEPVERPEVLRIVQATNMDFATAHRMDWLSRLETALEPEGIEIEFFTVESSDTSLRALVAEVGDIYIGPVGPAVRLVQTTGEGVKVIAADNQASTYVLLTQPEITSIDELPGATVGILRPGAAADTIVRAGLQRLGVDLDSLNFVEIGGTSARIAALASGQIDAGAAHVAEAYAAVQEAGLNPLVEVGEPLGPYIASGIVARQQWLDDYPDLAQLVVDALIDANRWAATEKDAYIELSNEVAELPPEVQSDAYDSFLRIGLFPVNGGVTLERAESFVAIEQETGGLPADEETPAAEDWVDVRFIEDYLERNGSVDE